MFHFLEKVITPHNYETRKTKALPDSVKAMKNS